VAAPGVAANAFQIRKKKKKKKKKKQGLIIVNKIVKK